MEACCPCRWAWRRGTREQLHSFVPWVGERTSGRAPRRRYHLAAALQPVSSSAGVVVAAWAPAAAATQRRRAGQGLFFCDDSFRVSPCLRSRFRKSSTRCGVVASAHHRGHRPRRGLDVALVQPATHTAGRSGSGRRRTLAQPVDLRRRSPSVAEHAALAEEVPKSRPGSLALSTPCSVWRIASMRVHTREFSHSGRSSGSVSTARRSGRRG